MGRMPDVIAHRLGRGYGPDSSRAALARSLAQPLEGLETDVCLTADGDLVLVHDPLLDVGTTLSGWAHDHTAAEICDGRLRGRDGGVSDERPLRLEELLDAAPPDLTLQLEVKAQGDGLLACRTARAICQQLRDDPARERVEVISFFSAACRAAAELGFRSRLVVIADYEMPALAAWARRSGVHGVCVEHFLLTPEVVAILRAAGLSITTGTVNYVEMLPPLLDLGVDAITSDVPHEIRAAVAGAAAIGLAA
jgi:glycerophosphoryl diester phosphodiesterase